MARNPVFKIRKGAILALAINFAFNSSALALPQGPVVANGQVAISQPIAGTMQVQASNGAIINWNKFSIGAGEVTRFLQPSASSAVLNRVIGQDISQILGQLQANGRVFLINPNGIVIGGGARIDTNGFIASTLDIADADFLAGKLKFFATGASGSISNQGLISVGPGGRIALIAPNIENSGIIQAPGGQILLAAGRKIEISSMDFESVSFEIQAPTDSVLNLGKLLADNGAVQVFAGTLRHSGEIQANRLAQDADGTIRLVGSHEVTLTSDSVTRADGIAGGTITLQSPTGTTRVAGEISARGFDGKGGDIRLLGDRVAVESGTGVDASGSAGGGQILVGGDYQGKTASVQNARRVYVGEGARLFADATKKGNGGRVIVWANENTRYFGALSARGGDLGGDGGFAEVSGKVNLEFAGSANLLAPQGSNGFLLLDPLDIIVSANGGILPIVSDQFADFQGNVVTISPAGLNLVGGNVVLEADRNIYFNTPTTFTGTSLTASAGKATPSGSIFLNENLATTGGSLDLSGYTVSGAGTISTVGGGVNIHVTGGLSYSAPIISGGGAVALSSSSGNISYANVNAGSGAVSFGAPAGSLYGNSITGGTATLNASGAISSNYLNASRIDATSTGSYVDLYNLASQPLQLGTINGSSGVYLHSNAGMQQVAGGLTTAPVVYLYGQNAAPTLGTPSAPLAIATPRLRLQNLAGPAYVALSGNPTLTEFYLQGALAGVAGTSLTGAANLSSLSLSAGAGVLNGNVVSTGGFGNGFTLIVSDAGINIPTLTMPGAVVTLTAGGGVVALGNSNSGSLTVSATGPISATSLTTTTGNISLSANKCTFYYALCVDNSPITVSTLSSAGSASLYNYDNGNIDVTSLTAAGSINVQAGSNYYSYVDYSYHRTTNAVNIGSASGTSIALTDSGIGNIAASGNLTASSSLSVNAQAGAVSVAGANTAGTSASFTAGNGTLALNTVSTTNGNISGTATGDITFQSIAAGGSNRAVTLNSSGGTIKTTVDNSGSDISATGNVTLSANGSIGNSAFVHPLDILAGSTATVSLTSSAGDVGALGKPVTVDTNGSVIVSAGGQFHVAVQDTGGIAKTLNSIDLSASAAGMGLGGTSVFSSQDLSVNATSDGSIITIGNIVQSANTLDKFRFNAMGSSGLTFGNVNLTTSGVAGHPGYAGYNQVFLLSGGALTQTTPGTNNINAGYINLAAGSGTVTVGNVTSSAVTGNGIDISGGDITAGNLSAPSITVSGANVALGTVTSSGTHRYYYSGYDYVPRLGSYQYVKDETRLDATGSLTTSGNITSATSAYVSGGNGVSVAGGTGTITGGNSSTGYYTDTADVASGTGTLASGNVAAYAVNISGTTLNTGNVSALSGNLNVSGTNFATGNLSAAGSLNLTATGAYLAGAIALSSGGSTTITAPDGIDLTTNSATLSAPTTYLRASGGGISGNLTGTTYLDLIVGGPLNIASTAALTWLALQAKGDQFGGASSITTGSGQAFAFTTSGGNTANLTFTSPTGVQVRYTESSLSPALASINLTANLGAASYLQIAGNGANINANSVVSNGAVNLSTDGDINLNSVNTGGSYLVAASNTGNINVDGVTTLGANVTLTASAGSILKAGVGSIQINTANGGGASSGAVSLLAANGSVGAGGSPIVVSKTVSLRVAAKNEIALDMNTTTLTNLDITTGASGSGAISIANNPNYAGFSLTRSAGNLDLGPVTPTAPGTFYLVATDGNIRVNGDINVANLKLDARNGGSNTTGDVIIQASSGPRSITASSAAYLYAGHDFKIAAGVAGGENVTVQAGYIDAYVGHDFIVKGDGGSALFNLTSGSSQSVNAGHDIQILGGSNGIAGASAAITSSGTQYLNTGNDLLIQGGSANGASAAAQATGYQSVSTGRHVSLLGGNGAGASAALQGSSLSMTALQGALTVQGGNGANAFAEIVSTGGSQSIGNQNSYYYSPTDFILVQGGGGTGAYASIRSVGSQTLQTAGDVSVLGGSGSNASAEIYSSGGGQNIGSTSGYYTPATQNILVQAGSGGTARIKAASNQTIMGGGNISVLGGSGSGMTASIESTGGSQTIGSAYSGSYYNPTDNVIVQGGTASGSAAWVKANGGQTIDGGQNIAVTGGTAGAYAEMSTAFGTQTIGNRNSGYDKTDAIWVTGGSGLGGYAKMASGGAQLLNATGAITVTNAGSDAASIIASAAQTINAASLAVSLNSPLASAVSEVKAGTNQTINLDGGSGTATLTVSNFSGATGSLAQVRAGANQIVAMPYSLAAGTLQVGGVTTLGKSLLYAGGTQNLLVGDLIVQGGATAAAAAKILSVGNSDISALNGAIQVLGGAAGSAAIDPPLLSLIATGPVIVTAGGAPSATATISGGSIKIGATMGSILITGGSVPGAGASIGALTGSLDMFASGDLAFAGEASASAISPSSIYLGGSCFGCSAGLSGPFSIFGGLLPVAVPLPGTITLVDPSTGGLLALLDELGELYGFLTLTEEGEITIDMSRRRLPRCG